MRSRAFLGLVTVLVSCSAAHAQRSSDEDAIRKQLAAYAAARQRGDGKGQVAFYAEDAEVWRPSTRTLVRGRSALAQELERPPDPNRRFRLELRNISLFSEDLAFVDAEYYGASAEPTGHAFYVMVKRQDTWLIRVLRTSPFAPPATR